MTTLKTADVCSGHAVHADTIERVARNMPADDVLSRLAELFKLLGDTTRVRILVSLSQAELCVCDLAELLGLNASAVSHQLRLLRAGRLVTYRRAGKKVYYSLDDAHVYELFKQAGKHVRECDSGGL